MAINSNDVIDPDKVELGFSAIKVKQPIGDLYISSVPYDILTKIAFFDVRRRIQEERDFERYLGIQRPLDDKRVEKLEEYVNFFDATFPTAIIVAISDEYASFDDDRKLLLVRNYKTGEKSPSTAINFIARVIDGQHRIAGLFKFKGKRFDVPVTVFIGADIADQAHIFSTVNLEQTKVHKNLVYDLYSLAKSRSPQKTCHNIAVALDKDNSSPFYERIKRLGGATIGRDFEPISQATFVESLLKYITDDPKIDRDHILKRIPMQKADSDDIYRLPFRNLFIDERDVKIGDYIYKYFLEVQNRWPDAWNDKETPGIMISRTNGFRAFMRLFGFLCQQQRHQRGVFDMQFCKDYLKSVNLVDSQFNTENFVPGGSGEARLFRVLTGKEKIQ